MTKSEVLDISDQDEFENLIGNNPDVVVRFTAEWCGPCKQFGPHYKAAAEKSDAIFVDVDVDKAPWATQDFGIRSVPTVMLFTDGYYVKNLQERTAPKLLAELA